MLLVDVRELAVEQLVAGMSFRASRLRRAEGPAPGRRRRVEPGDTGRAPDAHAGPATATGGRASSWSRTRWACASCSG